MFVLVPMVMMRHLHVEQSAGCVYCFKHPFLTGFKVINLVFKALQLDACGLFFKRP